MPVSSPPPTGPIRILAAVFGIVFGGIGLSVIGFMWTATGFHEPPLFFKVFASFIALAFVAVGGTFLFGAFKAKGPPSSTTIAEQPAAAPGPGYTCPACGARLDAHAEVSPKGDVKCGYCRKWFNIHG